MEKRPARMIINTSGGTAGKQSKTYRICIPTVWAKDMGITDDDRSVTLTYENKRIIIEKAVVDKAESEQEN